MTGSQSGAGSASGEAAQMKTMTYKGVLVDLGCGSATASAGSGASDTATTAGTAAGTSAAGASATAGGSTTQAQAGSSNPSGGAGATAGGSMAGHSAAGSTSGAGSMGANRSAGDTSSCPVTASSSQLGLKMDNGQVVRFDLVGNQRAQDELKNNKKWTSATTANKPIKVKISGVMQGDKLIVSSIK